MHRSIRASLEGASQPPRRSALLAVLLFIALAPTARATNVSRISAFVVGVVTPSYNPFSALFAQDPQFTYDAYPVCGICSMEENRKLARRYYPRTGQELIDNYDVMVFCEARIEHFLPKQFHDLDRAFREGGMIGASSPGCCWDSAWLPTILYHLMPVSEYGQYARMVPYTVSFRREREPVFTPFADLGMERVAGKNYHVMKPKEGATTRADMRPNGLPWLISWKLGGTEAGMMWVFTGTFDPPWWGPAYGVASENSHAIDMLTNLLFHSLDLPLIDDIHARREARTVLVTFQAKKLLALSLMEWADTFGANVLPLLRLLTDVEKEAEAAIGYYIDQNYDSTVSFMESMDAKVITITEDAVRLKDRAMAWVYASERLAVSGVSLVSVTMTWSLMVRRRMYRQAGSTRLKPLL